MPWYDVPCSERGDEHGLGATRVADSLDPNHRSCRAHRFRGHERSDREKPTAPRFRMSALVVIMHRPCRR